MRRVWVLLVNMALWMGLGPDGVPVARAQPSGMSGAMTRWPERITRPLRVFVEQAPQGTGWSVDHALAVHAAFDRWVATGIPIRLTFVAVATQADVTVRTVPHFADGISGRTTWQRDAAGWMRRGSIVLARHAADGSPFTVDEIHAVALHEVGHLLGLPHGATPGQIMAPTIRSRSLSPEDEATVRALYGVPAGPAGAEGAAGFDSIPPPR
jgi:predicted Zn-dependent protease